MKIILNGKEIDFRGKTLLDLITLYNLNKDTIAVEKNGEITHRDNYNSELLNEGDKVEIVTFVGGG